MCDTPSASVFMLPVFKQVCKKTCLCQFRHFN